MELCLSPRQTWPDHRGEYAFRHFVVVGDIETVRANLNNWCGVVLVRARP